MAFKFDEEMTKRIITKRAASELLTTEEENYSRKLFDSMMSSKRSVQKTVRIVTGAELRKEHSSDLVKIKAEEPTRAYNYPRQVGLKPGNDNPNAQPDTSLRTGGQKLPDVDAKPKQLTTENQRLSDITQHPVDPVGNENQAVVPSVEPAAKFVSADPVVIGDVVVKNFSRTGQLIFKGVVTNLDSSNRATVKWTNGMQTFEWGHLLVKDHKPAAPASEVKPKAEVDRTTDYPVAKTEKLQKDGDIVADIPSATPAYCAPFQELVCSLERVVGMAAEMKGAQARIDDPEVVEYYGKLIGQLREMSETILSALSMELSEAQENE